MTAQQHPADIPSAKHIARATGFVASIFLGTGKFDKIDGLKTIHEARKAVDQLRLRNPLCTRKPMVYATMPEGNAEWIDHTAPLEDSIIAKTEEPTMTAKTYSDRSNCRKAAMRAGIAPDDIEIIKEGERFAFRAKAKPAPKAEPKPEAKQPAAKAAPAQPAPKPPAAPASAETKPLTGKRAAIMEAAKAGKLPSPPDFSAETHKDYRKRLAALVAMAEAGDLAGLKAQAIKPYNSSMAPMARYRDLAVIALEAKAAA